MNRIVKLAHKFEAIVWLVAHCRKPSLTHPNARPTLYDILGIGHFGNLTTNAFIFTRVEDDEESEATNWVNIVKNRRT
jgi:hypothetical protein